MEVVMLVITQAVLGVSLGASAEMQFILMATDDKVGSLLDADLKQCS